MIAITFSFGITAMIYGQIIIGLIGYYLNSYYTGKFSFSTTNFNREHTLPKNWMNFRGVPNGNLVDYPEGADYHNLTLTDGLTNQLRSDYVFKIPTNDINTFISQIV